MSGSVNKCIILGHLGKDPEVRTVGNGDKVANFSVATSERWKDRVSGERKEKTEWLRVVVWGKLADIVEQYLKKGSHVYLEGKIETRKWTDQSGADKYTTEIVLKGFNSVLTMLDSPNSSDRGEESQDRVPDRAPARAPAQQAGEGGGARSYARDDMDDTIPFVTSDGCF